ncbi:aminotransferase class I/II-fold pyridoxal phosphate-dependent enzyme [Legionella sp. W05-934-2]|uniref:aminotransferase class I/II-fold pyridoxal phosphate-dependent enzyme n=1 Tax=Legionella sp. W05-934-2 TaxID=1198649 RepID=UPI00346218ED
MDVVQSNIADLIESRQQSGLYRQRSIANTNQGGLSFMTNDYLSLSKNEALKHHYAQAYLDYPTGSGGSPVNGGRSEAHERLENRIAQLTGCDTAVLFNSGYQANLAILSLLGRLEIPVVIDKAIHASVYDGIQLGKVAYSRFRHIDAEHLESKLSPHKMVITEGMFSMSGLVPPLDRYRDLVAKHQCGLMVDEAHSFGVLGQNGMGACEHFQIHQHQVPLRMISFAKSAASMGAAVVGQSQWIDALIQFARPYTYSTTMSSALAQGLNHTLDAIVEACDARQHLRALSEYFKQKALDSGMAWRFTLTPIKQLQLGCAETAQKFKNYLHNHDIHAQLIRSPTVPVKESGLRISLNACHKMADIDRLFEALAKANALI